MAQNSMATDNTATDDQAIDGTIIYRQSRWARSSWLLMLAFILFCAPVVLAFSDPPPAPGAWPATLFTVLAFFVPAVGLLIYVATRGTYVITAHAVHHLGRGGWRRPLCDFKTLRLEFRQEARGVVGAYVMLMPGDGSEPVTIRVTDWATAYDIAEQTGLDLVRDDFVYPMRARAPTGRRAP